MTLKLKVRSDQARKQIPSWRYQNSNCAPLFMIGWCVREVCQNCPMQSCLSNSQVCMGKSMTSYLLIPMLCSPSSRSVVADDTIGSLQSWFPNLQFCVDQLTSIYSILHRSAPLSPIDAQLTVPHESFDWLCCLWWCEMFWKQMSHKWMGQWTCSRPSCEQSTVCRYIVTLVRIAKQKLEKTPPYMSCWSSDVDISRTVKSQLSNNTWLSKVLGIPQSSSGSKMVLVQQKDWEYQMLVRCIRSLIWAGLNSEVWTVFILQGSSRPASPARVPYLIQCTRVHYCYNFMLAGNRDLSQELY